jgi:hypothetical protein
MRASINTKNNFEVKRTSYQMFIKAIICFTWGILIALSFDKSTFLYYLTLIFFIGLSVFIISRKDKDASIYIEIDKDGIWVQNQLLTDWNNYISSAIKKEYVEDNNNEKLIINIKYYKEGERGYFLNQLFFNGNEDKTEYEVIDAIQCFYENRKLRL